MAKARTPRQCWIDEGLQLLAARGPDAVRVEVLAKNLGVTKGGFYGHFADRNDLLKAMLETWEQRAADDVLAHVEHEGGDLLTRATRARDLTFSSDLFPIELAIRDWSRRDAKVAAHLHRVDASRIGLLREVIRTRYSDPLEIEARSTLAFFSAIGANFVTIDHGEFDESEVRTRGAKLLLGH